MSPKNRHRRESAGGPSRALAAILSRQRMYVALIVVAALALGGAMALSTRGSSHAAVTTAATASPNDGGVTWSPGDVEQVGNPGDNGGCHVEMPGATFNASDINTETTVSNGLSDEGGKNINQDGINSYGFTVVAPEPNESEIIGADASIDCAQLAGGGTTTNSPSPTPTTTQTGVTLMERFDPRTEAVAFYHGTATLISHGAVLAVYSAGMHEAIPKWLKGAIGALVGAVVYTAVSVITVATMVALGAATGPGGVLASPALAALAGCIGGAISTAVTIAIATSGGVASGVAAGVAGCITGGIIGSLPATQVGAWLGTTFRGALGSTDAVAGSSLEAAATASGADLSPYAQAMQDALSGLGSV